MYQNYIKILLNSWHSYDVNRQGLRSPLEDKRLHIAGHKINMI